MPPGAVEKAWINQGSLQKAGTWRSLRLREERVVQIEDERRFAPVCLARGLATGIVPSV